MRTVKLNLFGAIGQRGRTLPRIREGAQHHTTNAFRPDHRECAGPQSARGLSEKVKALLPRLARDNFHGSFQIFHAAGDIRIALGPAGSAVALEIHRPDIETVARKLVHHRIVAMPGNVQVKRPIRRGRSMDQKQNGQRGLSGLRSTHSLAKHVELHFTLLRPILVAPYLVFSGARLVLHLFGTHTACKTKCRKTSGNHRG